MSLLDAQCSEVNVKPNEDQDEEELSRLFANLALATSLDAEGETTKDVKSEEQTPAPKEIFPSSNNGGGPRKVQVSTCKVLSASEDDFAAIPQNDHVSASQDDPTADQISTLFQAWHASLNGISQAGNVELPILHPSTSDLVSSDSSSRQWSPMFQFSSSFVDLASRYDHEVSKNGMIDATQLASKRFELSETCRDIRYAQHVIDDSEVTMALWNKFDYSTAVRDYVSVLRSRIKCARDKLGGLQKDRNRLESDIEILEAIVLRTRHRSQ